MSKRYSFDKLSDAMYFVVSTNRNLSRKVKLYKNPFSPWTVEIKLPAVA